MLTPASHLVRWRLLWISEMEAADLAGNRLRFERVIWIVLDSVGIGELPDAADYGDVGRSTLGHIARSRALKLPNLVRLGLANISRWHISSRLRGRPGASAKGPHIRRGRTRPPDIGRWREFGWRRRFRFIRKDFRAS